MNDPNQALALPLAAVVDEPDPTPQERAQARRDRARAIEDPDGYYRAVHRAFAPQRRGHPPVRPQARPRSRSAHRPARRTGASSATSGSDPGDDDGDPEPPPAAAVNAVAAAWTASLRRRHPDYSWDVRP